MTPQPADLATFYALGVGTLLVSAALTWWERSSRPERRRQLATLTTAYLVLAIGCLVAMARSASPGLLLSASANLVLLAGYLMILEGVAQFGGRSYRRMAGAMLAVVAAIWALGGARWSSTIWFFASALPIAIACGLTAWEAWRSPPLRPHRSRHMIAAVSAVHASLYAGRTLVLPMLVARGGPAVLALAGRVTLYEAVLYTMCLPMAVLVLCRDEAHAELLQDAQTDHLTGLGNRAWFFQRGAGLIDRMRGRGELCLLAFDLDRFKTINDRFGHATGDEVLRAFAGIARTALPPGAILARIGGEEFVALVGADGRQAHAAAQAVADRFAATAVMAEDGSAIRATVSIGVAELAVSNDLSTLLSAADRALYVAKALGRNRIELADPTRLVAMA